MNTTTNTSKHSPVSLSRRHVLGDLYPRCDALKGRVPVYLDGETRELLGHADENLGKFSDAISFFLSDDNCKKLSSGHFTFSFDYHLSKNGGKDVPRHVVVTSITLVGRKNYEKPVPRR
jgi:hypothetical protein